MKRIFKFSAAVFLCASMVFTGCSCESAEENDSALKIVTTIFPPYDFAREICADKASLTMLVAPGGESHSYEPTPQDIKAVRNCDIFICAGGESDVWTGVILESINTDGITVISLMDCVELLEEEHDHEHDESEETEYDEHVWTSLRNAKKIASEICAAASEKDEKNADLYTRRFENFAQRLDDLDEEFESAVEKAENKTLIFADRFPFLYLFNDYGLEHIAAFSGCGAETDASAKTIAFIIDEIEENNISSVYYIESSTQKIADTIAEETGVETLLFHSCHTVSKEDFKNGVTYIDLMKSNLRNLKRGLGIEAD